MTQVANVLSLIFARRSIFFGGFMVLEEFNLGTVNVITIADVFLPAD